MILSGKKIELKTMSLSDVPNFYKWAIKNPYWYGEFSDEPVPSYKKFREDWEDRYFDDNNLDQGLAFSIKVDNQSIGEINYEINKEKRSAEFDILIFEEKNRGKGYGPEALTLLSKWLFEEMNVSLFIIQHVTHNNQAIISSEKAGFKKIKTYVENGLEIFRMEKRID